MSQRYHVLCAKRNISGEISFTHTKHYVFIDSIQNSSLKKFMNKSVASEIYFQLASISKNLSSTFQGGNYSTVFQWSTIFHNFHL